MFIAEFKRKACDYIICCLYQQQYKIILNKITLYTALIWTSFFCSLFLWLWVSVLQQLRNTPSIMPSHNLLRNRAAITKMITWPIHRVPDWSQSESREGSLAGFSPLWAEPSLTGERWFSSSMSAAVKILESERKKGLMRVPI